MSHRNAPLTPAGRLRLVQRCRHRPIAHVAAEAGVSRQCLSKWVGRYREHGEAGLVDRRSVPRVHPTQIGEHVVARIDHLRRARKWSARLIAAELNDTGMAVSVATVGRWLVRLGLNRRRDLDPTGQVNRTPRTITADQPGAMVHMDVKKVGRIPDGGGWRAHGRNSPKPVLPGAPKPPVRAPGYVYLHSIVDGYSRLAYTEALADETAATTIAFWSRAHAFLTAHGITGIERVVTDNGANYRAAAFTAAVHATGATRHQRIRPYTPRHNGKVERYQRILTEEVLYARNYTSETQRTEAIKTWNVHYNYHRPHTTAADQPPASRLPHGVTNLMRSYI